MNLKRFLFPLLGLLLLAGCEEDDMIWDIAGATLSIEFVNENGENMLGVGTPAPLSGTYQLVVDGEKTYTIQWPVAESRAYLAVFEGMWFGAPYSSNGEPVENPKYTLNIGELARDHDYTKTMQLYVPWREDPYNIVFENTCEWKKNEPKINTRITLDGAECGCDIKLPTPDFGDEMIWDFAPLDLRFTLYDGWPTSQSISWFDPGQYTATFDGHTYTTEWRTDDPSRAILPDDYGIKFERLNVKEYGETKPSQVWILKVGEFDQTENFTKEILLGVPWREQPYHITFSNEFEWLSPTEPVSRQKVMLDGLEIHYFPGVPIRLKK